MSRGKKIEKEKVRVHQGKKKDNFVNMGLINRTEQRRESIVRRAEELRAESERREN